MGYRTPRRLKVSYSTTKKKDFPTSCFDLNTVSSKFLGPRGHFAGTLHITSQRQPHILHMFRGIKGSGFRAV